MSALLKNKKFAYLGALICTLLWGTAYPAIKLSYSLMSIPENDIASKLVFAGIRFAAGGIMVYIIGCAINKKPLKISRTDALPIILLGVIQIALQYLFSYIGVGYTTASSTSIITACLSFFVVLLAPIFFKSDKLTVMKIAGCVIGFAGVIIINLSGISEFSFSFSGEGFVFISTFCGAAGNLITKAVMKNRNPIKITAFQLGLGGLILLLTGILLGGKIDLSLPINILAVLYLGVVSAVSFALWTAILMYQPVSKISVFNLLIPVFGTIFSGIFLGENVFNLQNLASLLLVCFGIVLVNLELKGKSSNFMKIKGIIFDMDGVLLDSEKLYVRFWCEAANQCGYKMEKRHALSIRSMARPFAIEKLKGYFGQDFDYFKVHDKRIELMDKYIDENGIETKSGALETLKYLKENGYKVALATATGIERTEKYLKQAGLYEYFDKIVCASMVKKGKPEPDIYIKAAELLGLSPNECMAVEDSPNGVKSASSAGCVTVMIPDLDLPDEETRKMTFAVAESLFEIPKVLKRI